MTAQNLITIALTLSANLFCVYCQRIVNATLLDGNVTCSGVMVIFTCETVGLDVGLAWSSDQYIGTGGTEISFIANDILDQRRKGTNGNHNTYATLTAVTTLENNEQKLTSELHIMASVSTSTTPSVTCRHTGDNLRDTQSFQVLAEPDAPDNLTAVQIAYTADRCFFTAIWQRPINSVQAGVTHYTVSSNGELKSNQTVDSTDDTTEFSTSFPDTCKTNHVINVTAGNICGPGPPMSYTMLNQKDCSELIIEDIPSSCYATIGPSGLGLDNGERNNGNVIMITISGLVVTAMCFVGIIVIANMNC